MLLNFGKCKCLHTGHGNLDTNYEMGHTVLGTTIKEKALAVTISADMKVLEHLQYCIQVWRPYHKKDIDTLQ